MEYVSLERGAPAAFLNPSTVYQTIPAGNNRKKIRLPIEFSLVEGTATVKGGIKTASILSGEFDMYSFDDGGINLLSFDVSAVSLDLENEKRTLSLFNLGNASASLGINGLPYASVMVSLWSPSASFNAFGKTIELSLHIGALGYGLKLGGTTKQIDFAPAGFGFSLKLS